MNEPTERQWELYKLYVENRFTEFEKRFDIFQRAMEARFDDFRREISARLDDILKRFDDLRADLLEERREHRLMFRWVMGTQLALIATIAAKGFNLI